MKLRDLLVCGFCLAAGVLFTTATVAADRRVALVIGNSTYKNASSLPNTINDSTAIAALFKSVGFEVVISRADLGVVDFKRAVREFLLTAENSDIAVVYYAGHGVEIGGTNYLVPVDAKLGRDYDVEDEAVALDRIIWALQSVKRLRLILLDACRDNPFPGKLRSAGIRSTMKGGLAKIEDVSADTLVAYAAKAGSVSYDGDGGNSPYATALIKHARAKIQWPWFIAWFCGAALQAVASRVGYLTISRRRRSPSCARRRGSGPPTAAWPAAAARHRSVARRTRPRNS